MPVQNNVIFIVTDTVRQDRLSSYGYDRPTSRYLDEFVGESVQFTHAISPAQWTMPSHASMFTGVYPSQHQLTQVYQQINWQLPTLAELLRIAGYQTVGFINNPFLSAVDNGVMRGFDEIYNYWGLLPRSPRQPQKPRITEGLLTAWRDFARKVYKRYSTSSGLL